MKLKPNGRDDSGHIATFLTLEQHGVVVADADREAGTVAAARRAGAAPAVPPGRLRAVEA